MGCGCWFVFGWVAADWWIGADALLRARLVVAMGSDGLWLLASMKKPASACARKQAFDGLCVVLFWLVRLRLRFLLRCRGLGS